MRYMVGIVLWEGIKALTFILLLIGLVLGGFAFVAWLLAAHTIIFFVLLLFSFIIFYGLVATEDERRARRWQKGLESKHHTGERNEY